MPKEEDMKIAYPGSMDLLVKITNGTHQGQATIGFSLGKVPTQEEILDRIQRFAAEEMPDGYRLMTKREAWDSLCLEKFGQRFAMSGPEEFDA